MENLIKQKLKKIEEDYDVRIIYAVESGSRAWGFSSSNSDYDVRFIYVHRANWYGSVFPGRDVIEVMDRENNLDFAGWDLRKALGLLYKGNPPLLEWLNSPIVYQEHPEATLELKSLSRLYYSVKNAIYHYLHMAEGNYKAYIRNKDEVLVKKYLYIIRPLLACNYLKGFGEVPPMEIDSILDLSPDPIKAKILELLNKKRNGVELGLAEPDQDLNDWLEKELDHFSNYVKSLENAQKSTKLLNDYLYKWMYRVWEK